MSAIGSDAKLYPSVLESERSEYVELFQIVEDPWWHCIWSLVSVEMGFSKLSLIQPKTSHVHVYSASHSVICKPFIGEKLYICQAWVVIDLHNEDLNNFVWSMCKSPCLLLPLEIDLSLWRHVWSLVEEFNPGSEKVWPAMTMLPHLTAQTQLQQQQKSITKLICVKNLNLKRHKKFYCIFCGHLQNLEVCTSRRTSGWQLAWKWRHDIPRETPHVLQMTSKNEAKKSGIGMCKNARGRRRRLSEWDTHKANNNCMMDCSVWGRGKEGGGEILLKIGFLPEIVS